MSVWSVLVALLMLGVLVTVHELGHFWAARLLKIKAYELSIFVGPKLLNWKRKGIEYSIRALPFGAYVRFTDLDEDGKVKEPDDPELLTNQPRWKRLLVALAGPLMNLILGVLIFAALFSLTGFSTLEINNSAEGSQLRELVDQGDTQFQYGDVLLRVNGDRVMTAYDYMYEEDKGVFLTDPMILTMRSHTTGEIYEIELVPQVEERSMIGITHSVEIDPVYNGWEIYEVSRFQNDGDPVLEAGDYLTKVNGVSVTDESIYDYLENLNDGDTMSLTYIRNGEEYEEDCIRTMMVYTNPRGPMFRTCRPAGFSSFLSSVKAACAMPYTIINVSIRTIGDVFDGEEKVYNIVSGPVGLTTVVSDTVDDVDDSVNEKAVNLFQMAALLSIGLMITNFLPLPGLDGNQLVLIIVEMVLGHKLTKKRESVINTVGFVMLVCLMVFALASDILRIILD